MAEIYNHDIPAWMDGTESLPDGEYRAYHVICQLIYLQNGPIVANEKGIAGRCNQHILAFRNNLNKLIEKKKLTIVDGKITNRRAAIELSQRVSRRTPRQPPANPPATSAQPPPSQPRKPLKINRSASNDATRTGGKGGSSLFSFLLPSEDSGLKVVSEERSSGRDIDRVWDFERFWRRYPHKVGKADALKSFNRAMKKSGVMFDELMAALDRYIAAKPIDRRWCNPATWLNQERWLDEPAKNGGAKNESIVDAIDRVFGPDEGPTDQTLREGPVRSLPPGPVR